ncbi:hypothetical protein [Lonepinella sp. BR2882]|uniref:hypothetical protein n=1 Tax=Lonepinella sp. BR2882 TaxID=3095283 RepID=UPI003F6E3EF7
MSNADIFTYILLAIGLVLSIPMLVRIGEIIGQRIRLKLNPIKKVKIRRWHNNEFIGYGEVDLTSPETIAIQLEKIDAELLKGKQNG